MPRVSIRSKLPLVRTSERSEFMRCKQKWWWSYVDRLKPADVSVHLTFGDLIHQALAAYYKPEPPRTLQQKPRRGPHPVKTFDALYDKLEAEGGAFRIKADADEDDAKWGDARSLGTHMLTNYIDRYGDDRKWRIIAPELPFKVLLKDDDGVPVCWYVGTTDALMEDLETYRLGYFEHKTTKTISNIHLTLDEQASTYWAIGPQFLREQGYLAPGSDIDFIEYNFMRKGFMDDRPQDENGVFLNKDGTRSARQPPPLFQRNTVYRAAYEGDMVRKRIIAQVREMEALRKGRLPLYKSPINGCTGMLGCQWRNMCELHEIGADWQELRNLTAVQWEPYLVHEGARN